MHCTVGNEYKTLPDKSASISCRHRLPSYSSHRSTVLEIEDEMRAEQSINADTTELKRTCDIANLETGVQGDIRYKVLVSKSKLQYPFRKVMNLKVDRESCYCAFLLCRKIV